MVHSPASDRDVLTYRDVVHKDYEPEGYGDHPRSRSAHGLRVHDHAAGWAICVVHVHGLRDLRGKMDTPARAAQADRLIWMVERLSQPDDMLVDPVASVRGFEVVRSPEVSDHCPPVLDL
ncbi:hypothetical protein [Jannaschia aquimarina]|uniref:hypothetical protein n=1 Tax=Jannaschia aquimarina TaxID=935700 RepID=UPI001F3EF1CD|nr:hypothetical protein [Jannaschia aquimarina]